MEQEEGLEEWELLGVSKQPVESGAPSDCFLGRRLVLMGPGIITSGCRCFRLLPITADSPRDIHSDARVQLLTHTQCIGSRDCLFFPS